VFLACVMVGVVFFASIGNLFILILRRAESYTGPVGAAFPTRKSLSAFPAPKVRLTQGILTSRARHSPRET